MKNFIALGFVLALVGCGSEKQDIVVNLDGGQNTAGTDRSCGAQNPLTINSDNAAAVELKETAIPEGLYSYVDSYFYFSQYDAKAKVALAGYFQNGSNPLPDNFAASEICTSVPGENPGEAMPVSMMNTGPALLEVKDNKVSYIKSVTYKAEWVKSKMTATLSTTKDASLMMVWKQKKIYRLDDKTIQFRFLTEETPEEDVKFTTALVVNLKLVE